MAQEWCVAHGTLPVLEADRLHRLICKRKNIVIKSSPTKKSQTSSKSSSGKTKSSSSSSSSSGGGGGGAKKKAKTSAADSEAVVSDIGSYRVPSVYIIVYSLQ